MNRYQLYNILKEMLSKNGAIPLTEMQYNKLMDELIALIQTLN